MVLPTVERLKHGTQIHHYLIKEIEEENAVVTIGCVFCFVFRPCLRSNRIRFSVLSVFNTVAFTHNYIHETWLTGIDAYIFVFLSYFLNNLIKMHRLHNQSDVKWSHFFNKICCKRVAYVVTQRNCAF